MAKAKKIEVTEAAIEFQPVAVTCKHQNQEDKGTHNVCLDCNQPLTK